MSHENPMSHLSREQFSALLDDAMAEGARREAEAHLTACEMCRGELAVLRAQDRTLAAAREHDPGDAYFEAFAARVEERVRALGAAEAEPSGGEVPQHVPDAAREPWWSAMGGWFRSPARLAWAGGVAVVVVAAGVALMTVRESGIRTLRDSRLQKEALATRAAEPGIQGLAESDDRAAGQRADRATDAVRESEQAAKQQVGGRSAETSRVREMRRNEQGEEVPVDRDEVARRFAAPPAAEPEPTGSYVGKPRAAQPLTAAPPVGAAGRAEPKEESPPEPSLKSMVVKGGGDVCGRVVDSSGRPLAGAQVVDVARGRTTTSGADGRFCIDLPSGPQTLSVMAVGFKTSQTTVTVGAANQEVAVSLEAVDVLGSPDLQAFRSEGDGRPSAPPTEIDRLAHDEAAGLPESLAVMMREAQRLSALAERESTAARWDEAAGAWASAAEALPAGSPRLEAQYRLAEARAQAWTMAPSAERAAAARSAVNAYLANAPEGPERERALLWRSKLGQ